MSEPKPLASLSGLLLARKGSARPAMRPQMPPLNRAGGLTSNANLEDLGWNDLGETDDQRQPADILPLTPAPKLPETQAEIAADDKAAAKQLAEHARKMDPDRPFHTPEKPEILRQQEEISSRLENLGKAKLPTEPDVMGKAETMDEEPSMPEAKAANSPLAKVEPVLAPDLDMTPARDFVRTPARTPDLDSALSPTMPAISSKAVFTPQIPVIKTSPAKNPVIKTKPAKKTLPAAKAPKQNRKTTLSKGRRAAFTLRLDTDRHLKLRLACTIRNGSAQQIVTEALDLYLGSFPELETLAAQVKQQ